MIKTEIIELNGRNFKHAFSDSGFRIRKVGTDEVYDDAVDILESAATYEETDQKVEVEGVIQE